MNRRLLPCVCSLAFALSGSMNAIAGTADVIGEANLQAAPAQQSSPQPADQSSPQPAEQSSVQFESDNTNATSAPVQMNATNEVQTGAVQQSVDPAISTLSKADIAPGDSMIVIDNDEGSDAQQTEETYVWQEIPDQEGKTLITTGAQFPVRVVSELSSKTAKVGDIVEGQTKVDIKIGGHLIAAKGTRVVGHVSTVQAARRMLIAECSMHRWFRANGEIGIKFDELITRDQVHIPLVAAPAKMARIVENKNEGRVLGVNANGEVASPLSIQLKHQAIHLAIRAAASAGGVFSMGAVPVAYAALGALNPSFAFMHPVGKNVPHRRLKGAAMGFISGVPGGFLIADSVIRGQEANIKPGDTFLVELKQDFTGQPSGDAELLPDGTKSVHGEIVKPAQK